MVIVAIVLLFVVISCGVEADKGKCPAGQHPTAIVDWECVEDR